MKPKNSKERRISFFKFTALFVVTVSAILAAVYFNFKVPAKENTLLRTQASIFESGMNFQSGFFNEMKSLKGLIDSMDIVGQNSAYQRNLIGEKIVKLEKTIPPKDSTYLYDMHMDVIELYSELQMAKDKLLELKDAESTIEEYKIALEECREDLKQRDRELYIERRSR